MPPPQIQTYQLTTSRIYQGHLRQSVLEAAISEQHGVDSVTIAACTRYSESYVNSRVSELVVLGFVEFHENRLRKIDDIGIEPQFNEVFIP